MAELAGINVDTTNLKFGVITTIKNNIGFICAEDKAYKYDMLKATYTEVGMNVYFMEDPNHDNWAMSVEPMGFVSPAINNILRRLAYIEDLLLERPSS